MPSLADLCVLTEIAGRQMVREQAEPGLGAETLGRLPN